MISKLFATKPKLSTKDFALALLGSVVAYLVVCWVIGFVLTVVGLRGIVGYIVSVLALVLLARIVTLVMRLISK